MDNCDNNGDNSLVGLLRVLRESGEYSRIAFNIKNLLSVKRSFMAFDLKVLLLRATMDHWAEAKNREILLIALGLLEGYYSNTEYLENAEPHEVKAFKDRNEKYLQIGPYVRTKRGEKYKSFDSVSDGTKNTIRESFEKQELRLIDALAKYIEDIKDIRQYVDEAVNDPNFSYAKIESEKGKKKYYIRLPKQCCFLEDYPPPEEEKKNSEKSNVVTIPTSAEVYQTTAETTPLLASWSNGNLSYTRAQVKGGILGDTIVFNSLSDGKIGDERKFVGVREDIGIHEGKDNIWYPDYIDIIPNYVYIIRLYIHNNNPNGEHAIAKNVRALFQIPKESGSQIRITGMIESSNAIPTQYWAKVVFRSDKMKFHLEYIPGTARLENSGIGRSPGLKISDDIISGGVLVSYDALNGDIPGGAQYASYITIRVRAVAEGGFRLEQRVRRVDTVDWRTNISGAQIGDKLECRIQYKNTSSKVQENVMVKNILSKNLRAISGTARVTDANDTRPIEIEKLITSGIKIGSYHPGGNALIDFTVEVIDNTLKDGTNNLVNWSQCSVGHVTLQDYATIQVYKGE